MCPLTNSKVRDQVLKLVPEWQNIAQRLGLKFLLNPLVNNEHMVFFVVDVAEIETLDEFINQSGIQQWNNVRVIASSDIGDAIKKYDHVEPLF